MGYGVIYQLQVLSRKFRDTYRIDIERNGYTGPAVMKSVGAGGVVLTKESTEKVCGTRLEISIQADVNFEYFDFFNYDTRRHRCKLYKNGVCIWTGHLIPDTYTEPFRWPPYDVSIAATDGLGALKNYEYQPDDYPVSRTWSLAKCLAQTGVIIPLHIAYPIQAKAGNNLVDFFHDVYFDDTIFAGKNCYEVIESILPPACTITQHQNAWVIRLENDLAKPHRVYEWNENFIGYSHEIPGENVLLLARIGEGNIYPIGMADLGMIPAWKAVTVIEKLDKRGSFLKNYDFSRGAENWAKHGQGDWLRTYRTEEETYLHLIGHNTAIGDRVSQSFFFQKWPNLLFEIQYCLRGHNRMSGAALTTTARFRITITNGVKTYYLSLSGWKEQESYVEQTMQTVQFGISWNTLKIFTNPPDISGTVTVEIFRVTSTYENRGDLLIGGILVGSVKVYTEELSELTDPRETTLNFRENATQYGNDIILMPCDLPEMANASLFFANGQYVEKNGDMAPVSLYSYNGGELRTWLQIIEENQRFLHGVTRQEISGDFRGQLLSLNAIIRIPACYNREYYIREASFNVLEDVFTLKMIEIPGTAENSTWILRNGIWDDTGSWMDEETWNDADPDPNN